MEAALVVPVRIWIALHLLVCSLSSSVAYSFSVRSPSRDPPPAPRKPAPWENGPLPSSQAGIVAQRLAAAVRNLETDRLVMRAPRLSDFAAYSQIVQSPQWHDDYYDEDDSDHPDPTGAETKTHKVWLDFMQLVAGWMLRGYGLWAVDTKSDDDANSSDGNDIQNTSHVGFVLLNHEYGDRHVEVGWMLLPHAQGHGYATEAAVAVLDCAEAALPAMTKVVSYIAPSNLPSIRVAERLGGHRLVDRMENGNLVYQHLPRIANQLLVP